MGTETQEPQTQETPAIKVSHCKHNKGDFSLRINVENRHVDLTTYNWDHMIGYHASIGIFDLTPDDIQRLGEMLITEALKIKAETT